MQSKQDGLIPIGEALADLPDPVKAIREASPQALRHFTSADQVREAKTEISVERWQRCRQLMW